MLVPGGATFGTTCSSSVARVMPIFLPARSAALLMLTFFPAPITMLRAPNGLGALGRDRQRGDRQIGAIRQERRNALRTGDLHQLKLHAEILGKLPRSLDLGAGRLVVLVENAERRRSHFRRDADFLVLEDAVERLCVRGLRADPASQQCGSPSRQPACDGHDYSSRCCCLYRCADRKP